MFHIMKLLFFNITNSLFFTLVWNELTITNITTYQFFALFGNELLYYIDAPIPYITVWSIWFCLHPADCFILEWTTILYWWSYPLYHSVVSLIVSSSRWYHHHTYHSLTSFFFPPPLFPVPPSPLWDSSVPLPWWLLLPFLSNVVKFWLSSTLYVPSSLQIKIENSNQFNSI